MPGSSWWAPRLSHSRADTAQSQYSSAQSGYWATCMSREPHGMTRGLLSQTRRTKACWIRHDPSGSLMEDRLAICLLTVHRTKRSVSASSCSLLCEDLNSEVLDKEGTAGSTSNFLCVQSHQRLLLVLLGLSRKSFYRPLPTVQTVLAVLSVSA
jgi:hypothetical protein